MANLVALIDFKVPPLDSSQHLLYNYLKMTEKPSNSGDQVAVSSIKEAKTVPTLGQRTGLFADVKVPTMRPAVRFIVIVLLALIGVCCFVSAGVIVLALLLFMPAFLTGLSTMPSRAILVLANFVLAGLSYGILGVLLPVFAYSIFRKKPLKRNHLVLALIALAIAAICHFLVPVLAQIIE